MKNQITILFASGLLAANAVMAAPATAHIGGTLDRASSYIAISIDPQDAKAYFDRGTAKYKSGDYKGATAEDGAQASLTSIQPSASILNMPELMSIGVMLKMI
jgi:hypothetical protein